LKLEFDGPAPTPEEAQALVIALRRFFTASEKKRNGSSSWRLAMRFPDATIEELRLHSLAKWDVL